MDRRENPTRCALSTEGAADHLSAFRPAQFCCCGSRVVDSGLRVVVTVYQTRVNNLTESDPIPQRIVSKSIRICSWGVLEPFCVAGRARKTLANCFDLLCGKCGAEDAFLKLSKIDNGTQIDQWKQDRHQGPLKNAPGMVFTKHENSTKFLSDTESF